MRAARARDAGFTLLEALAAVALMAAIMAGLATIVGQWLPAWRHGFAALQDADRIGLALDRVVEDVAGAEYARLDGGQGAPLFRGEPNAVVFVRQEIGPSAARRLEIVRIGAATTAAGEEMQRARASFAPGAIGPFRDATTLLAPPFRLAFAYAGPEKRWVDNWRDARKLPLAVRLTVAGAGGNVVASTAFALKVTAAPKIAAQAQGADAEGASARAK